MRSADPSVRTATSAEVLQHVVGGSEFSLPAHYKPLRVLGKGSYGVVCSAVDLRSGETVAIKKVADVLRGRGFARRALREVCLLNELRVPGVLTLLGAFHHVVHPNRAEVVAERKRREEAGEGKRQEHPPVCTEPLRVPSLGLTLSSAPEAPPMVDLYMVLQLFQFDLRHVVKTHRGPMPLAHIRVFMYSLLRALHTIHSANVVHRDISPSNVFIEYAPDGTMRATLGDFGLARPIYGSRRWRAVPMTGYVATRWYRPPEVVLAARMYTSAVDVWGAGCLFAELLRGRPLFPGADSKSQLQLLLETFGFHPDALLPFVDNPEARDLLQAVVMRRHRALHVRAPCEDTHGAALLHSMLEFFPDDRITAADALRHPFFASLYHPDHMVTSVVLREEDHEWELTASKRSWQHYWRMTRSCSADVSVSDTPRSALGSALDRSPSAPGTHRSVSLLTPLAGATPGTPPGCTPDETPHDKPREASAGEAKGEEEDGEHSDHKQSVAEEADADKDELQRLQEQQDRARRARRGSGAAGRSFFADSKEATAAYAHHVSARAAAGSRLVDRRTVAAAAADLSLRGHSRSNSVVSTTGSSVRTATRVSGIPGARDAGSSPPRRRFGRGSLDRTSLSVSTASSGRTLHRGPLSEVSAGRFRVGVESESWGTRTSVG